MNESRIMQQVTAIFSVFMVFFYVGVGIFLIWYSELSTVDKAVRVLLGSAFLFLGVYRAFRAWEKIRDAYFTGKTGRDNGDQQKKGRISRLK